MNCQKQISKNLLKFEKTYLKKAGKCVDNQNVGKVAGPCPDAATQLKIDSVKAKIRTKIELSCPALDLATLGFPASCDFGAAPTGIESACAALPAASAATATRSQSHPSAAGPVRATCARPRSTATTAR